jgi:hypothetical protein
MKYYNLLSSRIHLLAAELNKLCETPDEPEFKSQAEALVQEVDDIGYRILSVHSLSDEELLILPTNKEEQVQHLTQLMAGTHNSALSREEIFDMKAAIRQLQRELIMQYAVDPEQPWFRIMPHSYRLLIYNEAPGHPINRYAESFRVDKLLELRAEYETLLWEFRIHKEQTDPDIDAIQFLFENRGKELFSLHMKLLLICLRNRKKGPTNFSVHAYLHTLNTMLLQVLEMNSPQYFRDNMFWCMYDRLRWWVNAS